MTVLDEIWPFGKKFSDRQKVDHTVESWPHGKNLTVQQRVDRIRSNIHRTVKVDRTISFTVRSTFCRTVKYGPYGRLFTVQSIFSRTVNFWPYCHLLSYTVKILTFLLSFLPCGQNSTYRAQLLVDHSVNFLPLFKSLPTWESQRCDRTVRFIRTIEVWMYRSLFYCTVKIRP